MDFSLITDNWGTISTVGVTLLGGYAIKVRVAIGHVKSAVAELEDVRDVAVAAVADNEITAEEATRISKEITEALQAVHKAVASVMSLVPTRFQSSIPVQFTSNKVSKND